jgi:protein involved in polysaccharide export with SLBB domain
MVSDVLATKAKATVQIECVRLNPSEMVLHSVAKAEQVRHNDGLIGSRSLLVRKSYEFFGELSNPHFFLLGGEGVANLLRVAKRNRQRRGPCGGDTFAMHFNILNAKRAPSLYVFLMLVLVLSTGMAGISAAQDAPQELQKPAEAQPAMPPASAVQAPEYVLQRGDQLEIRVANLPDLTENLKIRPDGKISLVRLDDVQAAGLTPLQLGSNITAAYAKYYRNPQATVIVQSFTRQVIFIGGEVTNPGLLPLDRQLTVLSAVLQAGGAKRSARMNDVLLLRDSGTPGQPSMTRVNLAEILHKAQPDIELKPYDVVFLPKSRITKVSDFVDQYIRQVLPIPLNVGFNYLFNGTVIQ